MVDAAEGKPPNSSERGEGRRREKPWALREFGGKTVWDWLQLVSTLTIPIAIGLSTLWFTDQQNDRQQQIEEQRAQSEELRAYLDQMSNLMLNEDLYNADPTSNEADLARARTLTALDSLSGEGRGSVVRFLWEAALIWEPVSPVISLNGADLTDANLNGMDLRQSVLIGVRLRGAEARQANLKGSNLMRADLTRVDFTEANLSGVDFTGARGIDEGQLEKEASSLEGATMPSGRKYEKPPDNKTDPVQN